MSRPTEYRELAPDYDATRVPVGVELHLGCLARGGRPLVEQRVLEVGCGTGSYLAALAPHVDRAFGLDLSPEMLARAASKVGTAGLVRAALQALPLRPGALDAVLANQVLHHLSPADDFAALRTFLAAARAALAPGGALVLNTCDPAQLREVVWYYRFLPRAAPAFFARFPPAERLVAWLGAAGFEGARRLVPLDASYQGVEYADPEGPLDPAWRAGDSVWSTAAPEELAAALDEVRAWHAAGRLEPWIAACREREARLGQGTFVAAWRPSA